MKHQAIAARTVNIINQLPQEKASQIADFADFIIKKYEDHMLAENMPQLVTENKAFSFLNEDEDLYSLSDLKERY